MQIPDRIYKVLSRELWEVSKVDGVFQGAEIDQSDGYIHFSTAAQVRETVAKHFAGQDDLLLIEVLTKTVESELRWEPSRGGDLFPHLYGILPVSAANAVDELPQVDGQHMFPSDFTD